jgi:hypothetical protein
MSEHRDNSSRNMKERFRLQFQQGLREHLARHAYTAEGVGLVWERTLGEVPLQEPAQAELYWELMQWARSYDLFTSAEQRLV